MLSITARPYFFWICFFVIALGCSATKGTIMEQQDLFINKDSIPKLISDGFAFTEGPASDKEGNVFFTDQPNNRIWKYATDGTLSIFMEPAGRANGMFFDAQGNLLACADENNELWRISPDKKITVLLAAQNGVYYNGPNDVWSHPVAGIFFTDPLYERPYWQKGRTRINGQHLYYLSREGTAIIADNALVKPNGIVGSPDGKLLFVADIGDNKTYRYSIGSNGRLENRTLFAPQGSDGMTIDNQGNIYLTGNGVTVYNAAGKKIAHIPVPAKWTANVCFGGKEQDILFITASEGFYQLAMNVKGVGRMSN